VDCDQKSYLGKTGMGLEIGTDRGYWEDRTDFDDGWMRTVEPRPYFPVG